MRRSDVRVAGNLDRSLCACTSSSPGSPQRHPLCLPVVVASTDRQLRVPGFHGREKGIVGIERDNLIETPGHAVPGGL